MGTVYPCSRHESISSTVSSLPQLSPGQSREARPPATVWLRPRKSCCGGLQRCCSQGSHCCWSGEGFPWQWCCWCSKARQTHCGFPSSSSSSCSCYHPFPAPAPVCCTSHRLSQELDNMKRQLAALQRALATVDGEVMARPMCV